MKKNGGIKVTRMNERIIYCCHHFPPWFLYLDHSGLSPTKSYFSGPCSTLDTTQIGGQTSEITFEMQTLAYKIYNWEKRWEKSTISKIIVQYYIYLKFPT